MSRKASVAVGRPARLSHAQILDAAMALISEQGAKAFSLRSLARALGTVPSNLYTYFANKEALFDAMADRALAAFDDEHESADHWEEEIRNWMCELRDTIHASPALIYIIGMVGSSPGAVRRIDAIARLLQIEGLAACDAVLQAQSLLWTVMSFTLFELQAGDRDMVEQLTRAGAYEEFPDTMQHLAIQELEPLWAATVERTLAGLGALLACRDKKRG